MYVEQDLFTRMNKTFKPMSRYNTKLLHPPFLGGRLLDENCLASPLRPD